MKKLNSTRCFLPLFHSLEGDSYAHYKAMLISFSLHLILLMFELLACDRLSSGRNLWVLVFVPLIFGSVASVGACVWSVKHDRSFELELFMAVNALQFVFLPLKLDGFVAWSWEVVFVPLWIVLCLSLVGKQMIRIPHIFLTHNEMSSDFQVFYTAWYFVESYCERLKSRIHNVERQSIRPSETRSPLSRYWFIKYFWPINWMVICDLYHSLWSRYHCSWDCLP